MFRAFATEVTVCDDGPVHCASRSAGGVTAEQPAHWWKEAAQLSSSLQISGTHNMGVAPSIWHKSGVVQTKVELSCHIPVREYFETKKADPEQFSLRIDPHRGRMQTPRQPGPARGNFVHVMYHCIHSQMLEKNFNNYNYGRLINLAGF